MQRNQNSRLLNMSGKSCLFAIYPRASAAIPYPISLGHVSPSSLGMLFSPTIIQQPLLLLNGSPRPLSPNTRLLPFQLGWPRVRDLGEKSSESKLFLRNQPFRQAASGDNGLGLSAVEAGLNDRSRLWLNSDKNPFALVSLKH